MPVQYEEEEIYVLIDFKGAIPPSTFRKPQLFFNMHDLDKPNPVVQIGTDVYKGTYEDSLGTNMFFEEVENPPCTDIFEKEAAIKLQYVAKQFKVLNMEKCTVPERSTDSVEDEEDLVIKQFPNEYKTLLKKFNDSFDIEEYVTNSIPSEGEENPNEQHATRQTSDSTEDVFKVPRVPKRKQKYDEQYNLLQQLAREPIRRSF